MSFHKCLTCKKSFESCKCSIDTILKQNMSEKSPFQFIQTKEGLAMLVSDADRMKVMVRNQTLADVEKELTEELFLVGGMSKEYSGLFKAIGIIKNLKEVGK